MRKLKKYYYILMAYIFRYEPHLMACREKVRQYEEITGICNSKLPKYGKSLDKFKHKKE